MITYDFFYTIYKKYYHHTAQYNAKDNNDNCYMLRLFVFRGLDCSFFKKLKKSEKRDYCINLSHFYWVLFDEMYMRSQLSQK